MSQNFSTLPKSPPSMKKEIASLIECQIAVLKAVTKLLGMKDIPVVQLKRCSADINILTQRVTSLLKEYNFGKAGSMISTNEPVEDTLKKVRDYYII